MKKQNSSYYTTRFFLLLAGALSISLASTYIYFFYVHKETPTPISSVEPISVPSQPTFSVQPQEPIDAQQVPEPTSIKKTTPSTPSVQKPKSTTASASPKPKKTTALLPAKKVDKEDLIPCVTIPTCPVEQSEAQTEKEVTPRPLPESQLSTRSIIVHNAIDESMLSYKHWTGKYIPNIFKISIDNKELKTNEQQEVTVSHDNTLAITYEYEFMKGYRKGNETVLVSVPTDGQNYDIHFSWYNEPRITLEKK